MTESAIDLHVVLVHYRTPERLRAAVAELAAPLGELRAAGRRTSVTVVDNSGDAPEDLPVDRLLRPSANLGYAGGANLGVRDVPADRFLLLNPDVSLEEGCLQTLLDQSAPDRVVAPRLVWDRGGRLLLPPTERTEVLAGERLLAGLSLRRAHDRRRRSWRRHARRHWRAGRPLATRHLSGAALLIGREAWRRTGPFDESFRLYFEETDWLRRAEHCDVSSLLVPSAIARHGYQESAAQEQRSQQWFDESEALFRRRYRQPPGLPALAAAEDAPLWCGGPAVDGAHRELWFELSPQPHRYPAAAEPVLGAGSAEADTWQPPPDLRHRLHHWWLTVTDGGGRELAVFRLGAPASADGAGEESPSSP